MDALCQEAATFTQLSFRLGLAGKGFLCLLCVFASSLFIVRKPMRWMPSPSTKVLFLTHMFWTIEVPLGFVIVYAFDFIRFSLPSDNPCSYVLPASIGVPLRAIPGIGATFQPVTMFTFAIERLIATVKPSFFEKMKSNRLGLFLAASSTSINGVVWICLVIGKADWNDRQILSTVTTLGNKEPIEWLRRFYLCLELVTIFLFTSILCYNKMSRPIESDLSKKYQVAENKKVMNALLPCFSVHCFLNILQFGGFVLFPMFVPDRNRFSTAVWVELVFFQSYLYGLFMPLIIMVKMKKKKAVINCHLSIDEHFLQIKNHFDESYKLLKKSKKAIG